MPEGTTIYFAGFELNPVARSLKHEGRVVPLGPKTFDLLVYLALHPNQVVTKDELLTALWPSSFVEEGNLSQHVFLLRKALGLVSADQPIVVTIPGKGYQFAAMVEQQCGQLAGREELVIHAVETITRVVVEEEVDDDSPARLERAGARRNRKWLWRLAAGGAGLLLAAGGSLGWRWSHPDRAGHIDMVLSQIENETGDSDFDVTLNEALRIDLEQSPYLNLLSRSRIRETLAKMQRQKSEPLTASLAREICERNNAQVVLRGAISMVGKRYVFLLNAESCVSNKSIAGARAEADRKEDVLAALDRAASQIRRRLGESVASLDKFQVPIAAVSTPSLEALRAYSEGDRNSNQGNLKTAALLYENAVALDPEFASAYKSLSWVYYKEGEFSRAAGFSRKAFELRERTSERDR